MNTRTSFVIAVMAACCYIAQAQNAKQLVQKAVNAELEADQADHSCWIYHEVDKKPGDSVVQWVAETAHVNINRVMKKNGQAISPADQRQAVQSFIHDSDARAKQKQDNQHDDDQAASMLKMLPDAFIWRETSHNRWTTTFFFKPDPKFNPPTHEARVFAAMEGEMTVNNAQHRIQQLNGRLIHDVDFGFGLLGKLNAGGTFKVVRRQVGGGLWDITESHIHIQGHAMIFKSISEEEDDVKTQWQREPGNVTLEQAAAAVMKKPKQ